MPIRISDVLVMAIEVAAIAGLTWMILRERRFSKWPRVPARIIRSEVSSDEARVAGAQRTIFRPEVRYAYRVNGVDFEGRWLNHVPKGFSLLQDRQFMSYDAAEKALVPYPEGRDVEAIYNPDDPEEAFLKVSRGLWPFVFLAIAVLFLIIELLLHGIVRL